MVVIAPRPPARGSPPARWHPRLPYLAAVQLHVSVKVSRLKSRRVSANDGVRARLLALGAEEAARCCHRRAGAEAEQRRARDAHGRGGGRRRRAADEGVARGAGCERGGARDVLPPRAREPAAARVPARGTLAPPRGAGDEHRAAQRRGAAAARPDGGADGGAQRRAARAGDRVQRRVHAGGRGQDDGLGRLGPPGRLPGVRLEPPGPRHRRHRLGADARRAGRRCERAELHVAACGARAEAAAHDVGAPLAAGDGGDAVRRHPRHAAAGRAHRLPLLRARAGRHAALPRLAAPALRAARRAGAAGQWRGRQRDGHHGSELHGRAVRGAQERALVVGAELPRRRRVLAHGAAVQREHGRQAAAAARGGGGLPRRCSCTRTPRRAMPTSTTSPRRGWCCSRA